MTRLRAGDISDGWQSHVQVVSPRPLPLTRTLVGGGGHGNDTFVPAGVRYVRGGVSLLVCEYWEW